MNEKQEKSDENLKQIVQYLSEIADTKRTLTSLQDDVVNLYVFGENLASTEQQLNELRINKLESHLNHAKTISSNIQNHYNHVQDLIPSDIAKELNELELLTEAIAGAMDEKDREFKKARTIRTDYLADVDDVQNWIKDAELKVQDRSIEPQLLHEHLQQIQSEIGSTADRLEKLIKNGKIIVEKTRDDGEKDSIQSTIDNLNEQLLQVRAWLEEKKQQINETLDAWQRFLALYQAVMDWVTEKREFLKEPLVISTLQEAKQRLHDYSVCFFLYILLIYTHTGCSIKKNAQIYYGKLSIKLTKVFLLN